jgi:hypothetical protein
VQFRGMCLGAIKGPYSFSHESLAHDRNCKCTSGAE